MNELPAPQPVNPTPDPPAPPEQFPGRAPAPGDMPNDPAPIQV